MHTYIRLRSNPAAIGVPLNGVRTNQPARGSGCEQSLFRSNKTQLAPHVGAGLY